MANIVNTRIQLKNDSEANWDLAENFVPRKGELIIYNADTSVNATETTSFPRFKVGDGVNVVGDLPMVKGIGNESFNNKVDKIAIDNAGIISKSYTSLYGGQFTVTTVSDDNFLKPYIKTTIEGRINKQYMHRVTFDGTQYILRTRLWYSNNQTDKSFKVYEYLGNLAYLISDVSVVPGGTDNVPFLIISDREDDNKLEVLSNDAGQHTILVERITNTQVELPKSLIWDDNYVPLEKNNSGGTFNGTSIGVNGLTNVRGTIAIGYANDVNNDFGMTFGSGNEISGDHGIAIGNHNVINGTRAVAIGAYNTINGNFGITIGEENTVGERGHAIGSDLIASGTHMTAIGRYNQDAITTFPTFAPNTHYNKGDIVTGRYMSQISTIFTMINTKEHTSGDSSYFMDDKDPETNLMYWTVSPSTGDTLLALGNSSMASHRSNAVKVDWGGNIYASGDLYVHCEDDSTGGIKIATLNDIPAVPVQDVQINGTSIVSNGVATVPIANASGPGVAYFGAQNGLAIDSSGVVTINAATDSNIKTGTNKYKPIVPLNLGSGVFYGLARIAGDATQSASSNTVGTYTTEAKAAIRTMIGAASYFEYATDADTQTIIDSWEVSA